MSQNSRRTSHRSSFAKNRTSRKTFPIAPIAPITQKRLVPRKGNSVGFVVMAGVGVLLFFVFLSLGGHGKNTATASGSPLQQSISHSSNQVKGYCGNTAGQPQCPVDDGWFPASLPGSLAVSSQQASTMITASIVRSNSFTMMQSRFGYVASDTPVLVHAYQAHTGIEYYDLDHWVMSVRDATGRRVGVFDFVYDRINQRMRFSSFGVIPPQDPHAKQAFPYMPVNKAVTLLQQQRGLRAVVASQAELIFFPLDPRYRDIASNRYRWTGGGDSPMNPLWYATTVNRQAYFVGVDARTYIQKDLPVASSLT
jgi:hypothetical protein